MKKMAHRLHGLSRAADVRRLRRLFGTSFGAINGAPRLFIAKILAKKTGSSPLVTQIQRAKQIIKIKRIRVIEGLKLRRRTMRKRFVSVLIIFLGLLFISSLSSPGKNEKVQNIKGPDLISEPQGNRAAGLVKPDINFGKIPLYFITNKGQVNEDAAFYAKASRYTLWLTKEGLVFDSTRKVEEGEGSTRFPHSPHSPHSPKLERDVSRLIFLNANKNPGIVPMDEAKLRVNYFTGNDKSKWNCDIPTSQAVLYKNLYKNIDLKVYGIEKQIEYDWIIKPGGNPGNIKFEYKNVKGSRLDNEGNLLIETGFGELLHKRPVSYQRVQSQVVVGAGLRACPGDNERKEIIVKFKKMGKNIYGFAVGQYDKTHELVIDPVVLAYSTYLGGADADTGYGIAVDNSGNVYVTGYTASNDFPTLDQFQEYQGVSDAFITRIDTNQVGVSSLVYSTYLGGSDEEWGYDIAIDGAGNAYITGYTCSSDFPTLNQYKGYLGGGHDAFVSRVDTNQSGAASLIYSTYLGGSSTDRGCGIAVDSSGNTYVTGWTSSTDFPTLNQYQGDQGDVDAFVTRLDTNQSSAASLIYSTYLGGDNDDRSEGIAVDASGNAYVTGWTKSTDFPVLNQFQEHPGDYLNVFVTRIDTNQTGVSSLIYSTYLGGSNDEEGSDIAVDGSGSAYVTGWTSSTDFPTLNQYQGDQGVTDAFVTRVDTNQSGVSSLIYSTYLGGSEMDGAFGIAVDGSGNAYVTGFTRSTDFPILKQYQGYQGYNDAFITRVNTNRDGTASLIYSTYLGGGSSESGEGIAVDGNVNVYVTGYTLSSDFPTLNQYQDGQYHNAFVTKLVYPGITLPTVTTAAVSSITYNSAKSGGNGTDDGGDPVTARGVCWCISPNPTLADNYSIDGTGTGVFTSSMTGLASDMLYYVRAYATNSVGTAYGNQLTFTTPSAPTCIPADEREALIAFYNSTAGDNWFNNNGWKTPPLESDGFAAYGTEGTWYGVTVTDWHVSRLKYWANNLDGTLPPEIEDLSYLEKLELVLNFNLTGSIPAVLGYLNNLELLDLSGNGLSGPIPPELGNLSNLKELVISEDLNGTIPPQLGNLGSLEYLLFRSNLTGSIPPEFGNLSNLQEIYLSFNQLSGSIPVEIGNLTNLKTMDFSINNLSGSIPPELGNLINLQHIYLDQNQLGGSIPVEIGNLTNLISIFFGNNQLSGNIPVGLGNLVNLIEINIGYNRLEGNIPPELGNLVNLERLDLYTNLLGGSIPAELGNLSSLKWLDLYNNRLSGSIPPELGNLINLLELRLGANMLTGNIPSNLANIPISNLYSFDISYNALHTDDETLIVFLDAASPGWEETQTISPLDVSAVALSDNSIEVSWTPIIYSGDTGEYRVFSSTARGGPYSLFNTTEDKIVSSLVVTGLAPGTEYYFTVQTRTEPHWHNNNTVDSEYSAEVSATTLPGAGITVTSPNGEENWAIGSLQAITWSTTGTVGDVKIELSTDNGSNWTDIISSTTNDGAHPWTVPSTPSIQCLIRISETDGVPVDISDGVFTIAASTTGIPAEERAALIALYNSTAGDNWTDNSGWKTTPLESDGFAAYGSEDSWYGVTVPGDHVTEISLNNNHLVGTIPTGLENLGNLQNLELQSNQLSGTIPIELGNLGNLQILKLQSNQLSGTIPTSLTNLVNLLSADIGYNAVYTGDETLRTFLNSIDPDWQDTQTTAPTGLSAVALTDSNVEISWTQILYTGDTGGYRVFYSMNAGGPYTFLDTTVDKTVSSMTVTGLTPGTTYYFVVLTRTDPHSNNANTVDSEYSTEVSANTAEIWLNAPNGGENLSPGSTYLITWSGSEAFDFVSIEYSIDNGGTWMEIVSSAANTGGYNWTVPGTPSDDCLVRVRATDEDEGPSDISDAVFSIDSLPGITVTSPNGGENLTAGTIHEITWLSSGEINDIFIYYSTDRGASWTAIVESAANTGSYNWTVPDTPAEDCLVRVSGGDADESPSDISNTVFSILPPSSPTLIVTFPNGGEQLTTGLSYEITWSTTGTLENVKIEYSLDNGVSWNTLVESTVNTGSYNWTIPDTPSDNCLVRVSDSSGTVFDVSGAVFALVLPPTLTVTSPNGGESFEVGSSHEITWTSTGAIGCIMIEYSTDSGTTWTAIEASVSNDGSYNWTIPDTPSDTCLIRIRGCDSEGAPSDTSDAVFSISGV
jgi:Leucine-rich repeat (LRR) protein